MNPGSGIAASEISDPPAKDSAQSGAQEMPGGLLVTAPPPPFCTARRCAGAQAPFAQAKPGAHSELDAQKVRQLAAPSQVKPLQPFSGSVSAGCGVQVPGDVAMAQLSQAPEQRALQQTPWPQEPPGHGISAQKPLRHSESAEQAAPFMLPQPAGLIAIS
jgi:hypothetical protein